jgi:hypothetical protein
LHGNLCFVCFRFLSDESVFAIKQERLLYTLILNYNLIEKIELEGFTCLEFLVVLFNILLNAGRKILDINRSPFLGLKEARRQHGD